MSNMSKKKIIAMMALVIVIAILGTGTLAYFTTKAVVHNVITSGAVDIELKETMLNDQNEEVPFVDQSGIMPGRTVSKIVRVENKDEKAWIRVKVETSVTVDKKPLSDNVLSINYDTTKWEKHGGYYYYTQPVEHNGKTEIPLFTEVELLETTGNTYQDARIEIAVTAEAIQYQNNELKKDAPITSVWPTGVTIRPLEND